MGRMAKFQEEMAKSIPVAPTAPGPTQVPELVSEVERLRSRVAELEMEREEARKKRSRSLSVPSPDLVGGPDLSLQEWERSTRPARRTAQRGDHGDSHQPREHFGSEFQLVQPIGLRDLASENRCPARRVVAWGARGEARNPGPDDIMAPTQWESDAHFSVESRAPGLSARTGVRH